MVIRIVFCLALYYMVFFQAIAQSQQSKPNYLIEKHDELGKHSARIWINEAPRTSSESSNPASNRYIVKFNEDPLSKAARNTRSARLEELDQIQSLFFSDLKIIEKKELSLENQAIPLEINFTYRQVFNGAAITASPEHISEIKQLPYVSYVREDKQVKIDDAGSNAVIRATDAWNQFGITGKNITIAIIDTGIDYNHPDLGSGFGSNFKVVGGYDFVNEDEDPMDDHGHGTHVAGIAAANGEELKGVAPDAKLFAYKVLDNYGNGWDSWILAAIERCVDPDQNPDTDDAHAIVNMSLGRAYDANDPYSEAINNATLQGVTFVVAAGNSAADGSVSTPGVAELAITVGATNNDDNIAYFSSKGPSERDYSIKPDLVAPGVDIFSSVHNSAYQIFSGTSMAAPHVAGAAALLLEKNSDWTPAQLKAALMNTAKDINQPLMHQGTGRIDVYEALQIPFIFSPGSLSMNISGVEEGVFEKQFDALVHNTSSTTKTFTFQLSGELTDHDMAVSFSPSSVVLEAGASTALAVNFTINKASIPTRYFPESYTGFIEVSDGTNVSKVPVSVANPYKLRVEFGEEMPYVLIVFGLEENYYWRPFYPTTSYLDLFLPQGEYDMIAMDYNRLVFLEEVSTTATTHVWIDMADAKHIISFKPLDINGDLIDLNGKHGTLVKSGEGKNIITAWFSPLDTLYVSDVNGYQFDFRLGDFTNEGNNVFYDIPASVSGSITQNLLLQNDVSEFTKININNPSAATDYSYGLYYILRINLPGIAFTSWNPYPKSVPKSFTSYYSKIEEESIASVAFMQLKPTQKNGGLIWETGGINAYKINELSFNDTGLFRARDLATVAHNGEFDYTFGNSLLYWAGYTDNYWGNIVVTDFPAAGLFKRSLGDRENGVINYNILFEDQQVKSGTITNQTYVVDWVGPESSIYYSDVQEGNYKVKLTYNKYQVRGLFGEANVELKFNTSNEDNDPPILNSFVLMSGGEITDNIKVGDEGVIKINIANTCPNHVWYYIADSACEDTSVENVSLKFKKWGDQEWEEIGLTPSSENDFEGIFSSELAAGFYSLSLYAEDLAGNSLSYVLEPAFLVGESNYNVPYQVVSLLEPVNNSVNEPINRMVKWSTVIQANDYTLQFSHDSDFLNDVREEYIEETSYYPDPLLSAGKLYHWRVRANYPDISSPWSDPFNFETSDFLIKEINLLQPIDEAYNLPWDQDLIWTSDPTADYYTLQVAIYFDDFSELFLETTTSDTIYYLENLMPGYVFYWRVRAHYDEYNYVSEWTDTYRFYTAYYDVIPLEPFNMETGLPPEVTFKWTSPPAEQYRFILSKHSDFSMLEYDEILTDNTITIENLLPGVLYYWQVVGYFQDHGERWSTRFEFVTEGAFPISLLEPPDGATGLPLDVTFEWESPQVDNYRFILSSDSDFLTIVHEEVSDNSSLTVQDLLSETKYYWMVVGRMAGLEYNSEYFEFTTEKDFTVSLLSPANGSVDQPLNLIFSWESSPADEFRFMLSTNLDFTNASNEITQNQMVTINNLLPGTEYYWKVAAHHNNNIHWTDLYQFSTTEITSLGETSTLNGVECFPNPFSREVFIRFYTADPSVAKLTIIEPSGKSIREFVGALQDNQKSKFSWDGKAVEGSVAKSGIYFGLLETTESTRYFKIVLIN